MEGGTGTSGREQTGHDQTELGHGERREGNQVWQPGDRGKQPKCLDYTGKSLWGEGSPTPGLQSLG